jgi:uracil-DNA glycosylase
MTGVSTAIGTAELESVIAWWRDAGVDSWVDETPHNWLKPVAAKSTQAPQPAPAPPPATLDQFVSWRLTEAGMGAIAPSGSAGAPLMVITDQPEPGDFQAGRLISGDEGALFDKMLAAIKQDRASIYLASMVFARPVSGQIPDAELSALGALMRQHIALVRPERLWLLGEKTSRAILGIDTVAARGRKLFVNHDGCNVVTVASLHPRLLLMKPKLKASVWADMQLLMEGDIA